MKRIFVLLLLCAFCLISNSKVKVLESSYFYTLFLDKKVDSNDDSEIRYTDTRITITDSTLDLYNKSYKGVNKHWKIKSFVTIEPDNAEEGTTYFIIGVLDEKGRYLYVPYKEEGKEFEIMIPILASNYMTIGYIILNGDIKSFE